MRSVLEKGLLTLCGVLLQGAVWAATIDVQQSYLKATFTQFNVPVTGEFKKFSGQVQFDPDRADQTTASLSVVTSSYDLGDEMYNQEVAGKDWFDSKNHPTALFELKKVQAVSAGYEASGELTLRGVTHPIQFPAVLEKVNNSYVFTGRAEIKRLDYGVGQGDWSDTALVNDEVQIDFKLVIPSQNKTGS